jgi:TPR repeat protein
MPEDRQIGLIPQLDDSPVQKGKNWLLVIGINQYHDTRVPKLRNAVRDTERLTNILTGKYGFQLFRSLSDDSAKRSAVIGAIEELETKLEDNDNLIIFFSGHGYRKSKSGFIVPYDGQNDSTTDYISFADLKTRIDELPMRHFLFILDCCYAGSSLKSKSFGDKQELNKPSRRILAACSPDEKAQDGFYGRNSPFTSALAEILEENQAGELPVKTLHVKLRDLMNVQDVLQTPIEGSWRMESNRDGEFIFLKTDLDIDLWNKLKNNKTELQDFIERYPLSIYAIEATNLIQEIEKQELEAKRKAEIEKWENEHTRRNEISAVMLRFTRDFPDSSFSEQLTSFIGQFEEETAWNEADSQNTLEAFVAFQKRYKGGIFEDECEIIIQQKRAEYEIEEGKKAFLLKDYGKSFELLSKHIESKSIDGLALRRLGSIYFNGYSVEKDYNKAKEFFQKAIEYGDIISLYNMGVIYRDAFGVTQDFNKAFNLFVKAAKQGSTEAQIGLGIMHKTGRGVQQDYNESIKWYEIAVEQGNPMAQNNLANTYMSNKYGVQQDYVKALELYQKSAAQGYDNGQNGLANMYLHGYGISKDYNKAVELYQKSIEQGNVHALTNLGIMYREGHGVIQNYDKAIELFIKAVEKGDIRAQNNLGYMYEQALGVNQNSLEAIKYFSIAAEQGNAIGQNNLAYMYENGKSVIKDINEAVRLYRLSAQQDNQDAKNSLKRLGYPE